MSINTMHANGWYEIADIETILDGLRVFGNKDTVQIKINWEDNESRYDNIHLLSAETKQIYWAVPASESLLLGGNNPAPGHLYNNLSEALNLARQQGVVNNCTFGFTLHIGNHFIPFIFQIKNNKASILVVDTIPAAYDTYIKRAQQAVADFCQLNRIAFGRENLITIQEPQEDGVSCGPLSTLVNALVRNDQPLREQAARIQSSVKKAVADNKQGRRAYSLKNTFIHIVEKITQLRSIFPSIDLNKKYEKKNFLAEPWNSYIDYSKWQLKDFLRLYDKVVQVENMQRQAGQLTDAQKEVRQKYAADAFYTAGSYDYPDYANAGREQYQRNLETIEQSRQHEWSDYLPSNSHHKTLNKERSHSNTVKDHHNVYNNHALFSSEAAKNNPLLNMLQDVLNLQRSKENQSDKTKIKNNFLAFVSLMKRCIAEERVNISNEIMTSDEVPFLVRPAQTGESLNKKHVIKGGVLQTAYVKNIIQFFQADFNDDLVKTYFNGFHNAISQMNKKGNIDDPFIREISDITFGNKKLSGSDSSLSL